MATQLLLPELHRSSSFCMRLGNLYHQYTQDEDGDAARQREVYRKCFSFLPDAKMLLPKEEEVYS